MQLQDNKLIIFLGKLSEQEIKEFRNSYMNKLHKGSIPSRLLNYLQKHHPLFPKKKMESKKIHNAIFKNTSYNHNRVINAISSLRKELKRYLIWKHQDDFPFEKDVMLLQLYERYKLKTHFDLQLKSMEEDINEIKLDIWTSLKKMRVAHEKYFDPKKEQISLNDGSLSTAMKNLDHFFTVSKLKYACELLNRNQILQDELPEIEFIEEIKGSYIENQSALCKCFLLAYQLFQERKEDTYQDLKKTVEEHISTFSKENQHIFLTYLINHHSYRKKNGLSISRVELFDIYKYGVEYERFIVDGVFDVNHFNNIVDLGCKQKDLNWLKDFIEKYSPKLKEDIRNHTFIISKAFIHFEKQEFEKVIELIGRSEFKGIHNKLRYRFLQIAAKFENDEPTEHIVSLCNSGEAFAKRSSEMGDNMKQGLANFLKIVKMLLSSKSQKEKIITKFEKGEFIYFEDWLKKKVELLK